MTPRLLFVALLAAGLELIGWRAQAAPGDATRLEYARDSGAQHCPDRAALREAVSKRIGYDPFFPTARQAVVVEITSVTDGLRAQLRLLDEDGIIRGSRDLHERAQHCDELVASLALAISIALDPAAALELPASEPESEHAPGEAAEPPTSQLEASLPETSEEPPTQGRRIPERANARAHRASDGEPSRRRLVAFRAQGFAAAGTAPAVAGGFRLAATFRMQWLSLSAEFADQLPVSKPVDGGGRARASEVSAALIPCFWRRWASACGVARVGSLTTEGQQVPAPFRQSTAQAYVGARFAFMPELTHWLRLVADVDVLKSLMPVTLRMRRQDVWRAPALSGALGLGLEVQFP